jgi:hypothetical protein
LKIRFAKRFHFVDLHESVEAFRFEQRPGNQKLLGGRVVKQATNLVLTLVEKCPEPLVKLHPLPLVDLTITISGGA